ncbi:hypothetical protein [Ornithinimicrobium sediminis]|uniref:hypothetical protein n=1 Tax=Ornithinimicrobium sediminis TaxID=2904603 RepID=UPI001E5612DF|nr:hypothetical protein [Ornithinimicrobium sediminis]MCE0487287.1 hypothetical protein [Ornithinimicrobium sediminis]
MHAVAGSAVVPEVCACGRARATLEGLGVEEVVVRARVKSVYPLMALALVGWIFARPSALPLLLLLGLAVVAGMYALAGIDARRDPGGRGPTEQHIAGVQSRYPYGSGF